MVETKVPATQAFPAVISEAVILSTAEFFRNVCGASPIPISPGRSESSMAGVMGVISFIGDHGFSYAIALPEHTAVPITRKFAGFDISFESPDMGDVVGELANIVAGAIVARLENKGIKVAMSLPLVTRGHDVELLVPPGLPTLRLGFEFEDGNFWVKLVTARSGSFLGRRPGT